jgi:hypothetical protein
MNERKREKDIRVRVKIFAYELCFCDWTHINRKVTYTIVIVIGVTSLISFSHHTTFSFLWTKQFTVGVWETTIWWILEKTCSNLRHSHHHNFPFRSRSTFPSCHSSYHLYQSVRTKGDATKQICERIHSTIDGSMTSLSLRTTLDGGRLPCEYKRRCDETELWLDTKEYTPLSMDQWRLYGYLRLYRG